MRTLAPPPPPNAEHTKMRLCEHFSRGSCAFGDKCECPISRRRSSHRLFHRNNNQRLSLPLTHTHTHSHTHTHTHLVSRELKCEEVCREDFYQIAGNFAHGLHELKGLKRRQEIEQGRCGECGGGGLVGKGKVDPSDGSFYCDACWEQFAGGVGGGPPLPPPSSCHRGGVARGGYESAQPVSAWQKEEKNKAHDFARIDEEARCAQFPCQSWGPCPYFHSYLTILT